MDRSKHFSTIHGPRTPGDPFLLAKFQQDGIHYDAQGLHIDDLVGDEKTRSLVEKRLKRQVKAAPKKTGAGEEDNDTGPDDESGPADVNLESWLRGESKYDWFVITKAMRERYKVNLNKQADVVEFLVIEQKVVAVDELDPDLAALLKQQN